MSDLTERAKALADEATPGPWYCEDDDQVVECRVDPKFIWHAHGPPGAHNADAVFIAASRELVPALVAEVERLEAELEELCEARLDEDGLQATLTENYRLKGERAELVERFEARVAQHVGDLEYQDAILRDERDELVGRNEQLQAELTRTVEGFRNTAEHLAATAARNVQLVVALRDCFEALKATSPYIDTNLANPYTRAPGRTEAINQARALLASLEDSPQ